MLLRLVLRGLVGVVAAAAFFVSDEDTLEDVRASQRMEGGVQCLLLRHHLRFPGRPLAGCAAFVAVVDLLFDFVPELGVGVFLFGRHGRWSGVDGLYSVCVW